MPCPTEALNEDEIRQRLVDLPGWDFQDNAIQRVYTGKTYLDALEVLSGIARLSEAADHHPDLTLAWKKLTIRFWTHTAKGVSALDFELARQVETFLSGISP